MQENFWQERWQERKIGFHLKEPNQNLVKHFGSLDLNQGQRVFVPLCGKTNDMVWLLAHGYRVVGAELVESAVQEFFKENNLTPSVKKISNGLSLYSEKDIDIFVGNIFELTPELVGQVHGIYDRAALVALPPQMRIDYTKKLRELSANAPQLLVTFVYDQTLMDGPPFSIVEQEVHEHYDDHYKVTNLETFELESGLKTLDVATTQVWHLMP
jgi:thiopurine S-methyltransferase